MEPSSDPPSADQEGLPPPKRPCLEGRIADIEVGNRQEDPTAEADPALRVTVEGDYLTRIWRMVKAPENDDIEEDDLEEYDEEETGQRQLERETILLELLTRARSPIKASANRPKLMYVGHSGENMQPVFLHAGKNDTCPQDATLPMGMLRTELMNNIVDEKRFIPHFHMLISENVARIKELLSNPTSSTFGTDLRPTSIFGDAGDPYMHATYIHRRINRSLPADPLTYKRPAPVGSGTPSLNCLSTQLTIQWKLEWPLLGLLNIPTRLVTLLDEFKAKYERDLLPRNLAVAATIIYFDMKEKSDTGLKGEDAYFVSLAMFLLYFPHWLRFAETHGLAWYPHPFRFAQIHYCADVARSESFTIKPEDLDTVELQALVKEVTSRLSSMRETTRFRLLPASMPGTRMTWPTGGRSAMKGTPSLYATCMLDDIRTVGLPSYRTCQAVTMNAGITTHLAKMWAPSVDVSEAELVILTPSPFYWEPDSTAGTLSHFGGSEMVGPVFSDLIPALPCRKAVIEEEEEVNVGAYFSPALIARLQQRGLDRHRLIRRMNPPDDAVYMSADTLLLEYEGRKHDEVLKAVAEGSLGSLYSARPIQASPPPPR